MEFEDTVPNDDTNVGALLDNIDQYSARVIYDAIVGASEDVLIGYFGVYQEARDALTNRLDALLNTGGATVDSETVKAYCVALIPLIDDVDAANRVNGVPQNALDQQQQTALEQAEAILRQYLDMCSDVYDAIKIFQDNQEYGLAEYLTGRLNLGGCNNVFSDLARSVVVPFAEHGYVRLEEMVRDHLLSQLSIPV
jgi:hypothetical protein